MYILEDLIAKLKVPGSKFAKVTNKDSITLEELLSEYRDIHLILSHYGKEGKVLVLKVDSIYDILLTTDRSQTIQSWLESVGNVSLPVTEDGWELVQGQVVQTDLLDVGFRATLVDDKYKESSNKHREDMVHVKLTDNSGRHVEYGEHCIFTCNGLLHIHDYNDEGIFLSGAGVSTNIENKIQFSSISFHGLGPVKVIPIDSTMIKRHNGGKYHNGFYLHLDDESLLNKTVMLSICGVLHYSDQDYTVISDNEIKVHWSNIGFIHRYIEFRNKIDWGLVEDKVGRPQDNNIFVDNASAEEDDVILHALQMPQTFIIVVDVDNVSYDKLVLERTRLPGRFIANTVPHGPIVLGNGLMHPYRVREESGNVFSIVMADTWLRNKYEDTRGRHGSNNIMTNDKSQWPKYLADGYMLNITTEVIKT